MNSGQRRGANRGPGAHRKLHLRILGQGAENCVKGQPAKLEGGFSHVVIVRLICRIRMRMQKLRSPLSTANATLEHTIRPKFSPTTLNHDQPLLGDQSESEVPSSQPL